MGDSMWHSLIGTWGYTGGTGPGTVTVPLGAALIQIVAHAQPAGTVTIFGGPAITLPPNDVWTVRFNHTNALAASGANTVVFSANTTSYFVEWIALHH